MIRFALKCDNDHRFESWFQSGSAFDALRERNLVVCPTCSSSNIAKDLMAPKIGAKPKAEDQTLPVAHAPDPELADAIQKLRTHVEENSDYVGTGFAREARAMHVGDQPQRPIYGEVAPKDAKELLDDGVPAVPLPFIPRQKSN